MKSGETMFTSDRLIIRRVAAMQQVTLSWSGECDFQKSTETLGPILDGLSRELEGRQLVLDFRALRFMNSSSVTPILAMIKGVCSKGTSVHLIYNANLSWQRSMASSMRTLSHVLKSISIALQTPEESPH